MTEFSAEPGFDRGELEEAIRVIHDYATTGGEGNVGGSGLSYKSPEIERPRVAKRAEKERSVYPAADRAKIRPWANLGRSRRYRR
jgi:hypothetical protein